MLDGSGTTLNERLSIAMPCELPAAVASLTFFAQPVVGSLLGWLFLKETITPLFLIGGVLIAIGLVISSTG